MQELGKTPTNLPLIFSTSFTVSPDKYSIFNVQFLETENKETHIGNNRVGDAIQPSHPLSSPSPPDQSLPASESFPMSQLFT